MKQDLDLEANARRALVRLIDEIDVDAPLPADEPQQTLWRPPMVAMAVGLALIAAGVIAVEALDRGSRPAAEVTAAELSTEEILWSSGTAPDDGSCPPNDMPDAGCHYVAYANVDGELVVSGSEWGPGVTDPEQIRLRYTVDGELDEVTFTTTPGDLSVDVREWSATVPQQVPELIDEATHKVAVDFFEFTALDQNGNALWTFAAYAGPLE